MAATKMNPGDPVPDLRVIPSRFLPHRYAGASGDFNPIHIDPETARSQGQPRNILHGLYMMTIMARAVGELGGGDPRRLKRLAVQFEGAGYPEKELRVEGQVTESDGDRVTVQAQITQEGDAVLSAEAEVLTEDNG